jgi:hypothetical protein
MKLSILFFALLALLCSCATSINTTLVNENYTGKQNTKKDLIIFPIQYKSLSILNGDDVVDDFKIDLAEGESFIYDTLSISLLINSKSCTRYLNIIDGKQMIDWDEMMKDSNNYFLVKEKIDDNYNPTFFIPKKELLNAESCNSYALIIKKIVIGRNVDNLPGGTTTYTSGQTVSTPGGTFQTPGHWNSGWTPENLGARTEFIIWDYEKNDFVKCGLVTSKEEILGSMTSGTWVNLFKSIPLNLYEDTPFGISPVNYYYKK